MLEIGYISAGKMVIKPHKFIFQLSEMRKVNVARKSSDKLVITQIVVIVNFSE